MGRKAAFLICEIARNEVVKNDSDLTDFVLGLMTKNKSQGLPNYNKEEVSEAIQTGVKIIEESEKSNIKIISIYDKDYPASFKIMHDRPLLMNLQGNYKEINRRNAIAIIGTREPTKEGIKAGEFLGEYFGIKGYNVVSGLAKGCDTVAHRGCLKVHGMTTAILAHGLHMVYPTENQRLAQEILENDGILMSEYFIGTGAEPGNFIERDKLQAGLSSATIVIQTDIDGSTMFAVNATLKSSKPLAAVKYKPGIVSNEIRGNEMLIHEDKAFPLTSANIDEFINLIPIKSRDK
jgi:DNA processing protein